MPTSKDQIVAALQHEDEQRGVAACNQGDTFRWEVLVPVVIHPVQVAIVEAMDWLRKPVSAKEIQRMFQPDEYTVSAISYHMRSLADHGVIEETGARFIRGAKQTFYFLSPSMMARVRWGTR